MEGGASALKSVRHRLVLSSASLGPPVGPPRGAGPGGEEGEGEECTAPSACEWEPRGEPPGGPGRHVMSANHSTSTELWTEEPWNSSTAASTASASTGLGLVGVLSAGISAGLAAGLSSSGQGDEVALNATARNETVLGTAPTIVNFCDNWEAIQNNLFQVANLFFCIAFMVPRHFKQSVLLYRFLLVIGCLISAVWASFHLCAFDVFVWNSALLLVNAVHTAFLVVRFLPPALSPDLTELYLKVFRPLKVSKKAFKELAREGAVLTLEAGDTYAVEEQTPADERLSILLKGKLSVSCDGTHLHHINIHQFVDSPEWEANHDTSENTFQVTIAAEEESVYLCWPRMKLSRVLRHRPQVRIVLDTLIGKDITHKLYSLNEQMHGAGERARAIRSDHWRRTMTRSVSVDAVNTGTRGNVRSAAFRTARKERAERAAASDAAHATHATRGSLLDDAALLQSPVRAGQAQCWIPLVANHFPITSPFTDAQGQPQPLSSAAVASVPVSVAGVPGVPGVPVSVPLTSLAPGLPVSVPSSMALVPVPVIVPVLAPPPTLHQARSRSMSRSVRRAGPGPAMTAAAAGPGVKFEQATAMTASRATPV